MGGKTQPGCLPELRTQIWKSGEAKAARIHSIERGELHSERMLGMHRRLSLSIQFSTRQHVHMKKQLQDGKGYPERIGRSSIQNLPRQGIVPILTARVENFII